VSIPSNPESKSILMTLRILFLLRSCFSTNLVALLLCGVIIGLMPVGAAEQEPLLVANSNLDAGLYSEAQTQLDRLVLSSTGHTRHD